MDHDPIDLEKSWMRDALYKIASEERGGRIVPGTASEDRDCMIGVARAALMKVHGTNSWRAATIRMGKINKEQNT